MDIPKAFIEAGARALVAHEFGDRMWETMGPVRRAHWEAKATACLAAVFGRAEFLGRIGDAAGVSVDVRTAGAKVADMHPGDTLVIVRGADA